jgi:hypothetical protein
VTRLPRHAGRRKLCERSTVLIGIDVSAYEPAVTADLGTELPGPDYAIAPPPETQFLSCLTRIPWSVTSKRRLGAGMLLQRRCSRGQTSCASSPILPLVSGPVRESVRKG